MALSATQRDFVASAYAAARAAGLSGVQADLAVSQAIHESAWGTRPSGTNNVHGIKGKGKSVQTHEVVGGKRVNQRASFRNFGSLTDSFRAWKGLMERRFSKVMNAPTLAEAVKGLRAGKPGGYATDPNYDSKVKATARLVASTPVGMASRAPQLMDAPSMAPLMARMDSAPIPANLPSAFRPDNMMAAGPRFSQPAQVARAPLQAPAPERFGGRGSGMTAAPVMAGFAPDPSRFGRQTMAPPAPTRGDRVGSGSFSVPPDPARFGPSPSAPLSAPRMAQPDAIDPARFGQIAMGPIAAPVASAAPQMRSPRSMEVGPGALSLDFVPPELMPAQLATPAPVEVPPAPVTAPPLAAPRVVREMPVHSVDAGFPSAPPRTPAATPMDVYRGLAPSAMSASGNQVSRDQFGNTSVTNQFGATTMTLPDGSQAATRSPIAGPLGQGGGILSEPSAMFEPQDRLQGRSPFGNTARGLGGGLAGAGLGGLLAGPLGAALGAFVGKELAKPGGGRVGGLFGGGNRTAGSLPEWTRVSPEMFPQAPRGQQTVYQYPEYQSNRSLNDMRDISPAAADAISRGTGGLY